ncbi:MAG: restriction endonuclease [Chloroflexota bacterium]|nr:restriction endonuclease [Chloroflexota bacterium]
MKYLLRGLIGVFSLLTVVLGCSLAWMLIGRAVSFLVNLVDAAARRGPGQVLTLLFLFAVSAVVLVLVLVLSERVEREEPSKQPEPSGTEPFDRMDRHEFEEFLAGYFRRRGYYTEVLPRSGRRGVDILLSTTDRKVAVQARRRSGTVGYRSVQEIYLGMRKHRAQEAWIVTTSQFSPQAVRAAEGTEVRLVDREELIHWLASEDTASEAR